MANELVYEFNGGENSQKLYEEAYYIRAYSKRFLNNPRKKTHSILTTFMMVIIYGAIMIAIGVALLIASFSKILSVVAITIGVIVVALFLRYYLSYKKYISVSMKSKVHKTYTISEEKITFKDPEKEFGTEWDNISNIIVNKYSICFLPKELTGVFYVLPVEYFEDICKYMKTIGREGLIVDNRK